MRLHYWGVVRLELDIECCIRDRFIARRGTARRGADMYVDVLGFLVVLIHKVKFETNGTNYKAQKNNVDDAAIVDECVAAIQPLFRTCSRAISLSEVGYSMPVFQKLQFSYTKARVIRKARISRRVQHDDQTRVGSGRIRIQNGH